MNLEEQGKRLTESERKKLELDYMIRKHKAVLPLNETEIARINTLKDGLVKRKEQKKVFQSAVQKPYERNAKIKEEIQKLASQHPRIETEFKLQ